MVEVTQADRLEAVRIYQRFRDHDYAKWIGDGTNATGDADGVMQAFARHRIAAAQAERAAVAEWLRKRHDGGLTSRIYLATAIEAGEHRTAAP